MTNRLYKNTILVYYPGGGYGSFLHWALEYFSGNLPSGDRPFTKTGSSHYFVGLKLNFSELAYSLTTEEYLSGSKVFQFGRTHGVFTKLLAKDDPGYIKHKSFVHTYLPFFKKIICLNQNSDCHLLIHHNILTKIRDQNYHTFFNETIDQYAAQFNATLPVPNWQLREMLSFKHGSQMHYLTEFYQPVDNKNVININITNLVNNFESTLQNLFAELNLPMIRKSELEQVKDEWLGCQKFIKIDNLCHSIVDAVLSDQRIVWNSNQLTVLDEAYIQYLLRNNGLEIQCNGLDMFPTSSVQLKELLKFCKK